MQKAQVFLTEEQKSALKEAAAATGRKQSEIIRRGVDLAIAECENKKGHWQASLKKAAGLWKERDDVEQTIADNRARWREREKEISQ